MSVTVKNKLFAVLSSTFLQVPIDASKRNPRRSKIPSDKLAKTAASVDDAFRWVEEEGTANVDNLHTYLTNTQSYQVEPVNEL